MHVNKCTTRWKHCASLKPRVFKHKVETQRKRSALKWKVAPAFLQPPVGTSRLRENVLEVLSAQSRHPGKLTSLISSQAASSTCIPRPHAAIRAAVLIRSLPSGHGQIGVRCAPGRAPTVRDFNYSSYRVKAECLWAEWA